jgi:hypothetical protein
MKSKWSAAEAKRMITDAEKSLKDFHPQTRQALKIIFMNVQEGLRVSYHGFPISCEKVVAKELRGLGYEVISHKTHVGYDLIKYEVRVV